MASSFPAMGSPSTSTTTSPIIPSSQPLSPAYRLPTSFQILSSAGSEVFQRVLAQSSVDLESYVRSLGDKQYNIVKQARRTALLRKAKIDSGRDLDDVTIRKKTNLASAEASRAKKEYIMDQLSAQLKNKMEDAVVLAQEMRKLLMMVEQQTELIHKLGARNQQLEVQLQQPKFFYDPSIVTQGGQSQGQVVPGSQGMDVSRGFGLEARSDDHQQLPQTTLNTQRQKVQQSERIGETGPTGEYPLIDNGAYQAEAQSQNVGLRTRENQTHTAQGTQSFDVSIEYSQGMENFTCPPNMNQAGYEMEKMNALQYQLPSIHTESSVPGVDLMQSPSRNQGNEFSETG